MSVLKIQKLLATLNSAEMKEMDESVAMLKRESLKNLYKVVKRNVKQLPQLDKEQLFVKSFERDYSKKEDYLLRNELRLLTDKANQLLIKRMALDEVAANDTYADELLLRSLFNRELFAEFVLLYQKALPKAIEQFEYDRAQRMARMYFRYLMVHGEISPDLFKEAHAVLSDSAQWIKLYYRTQLAINVHGRVACESTLKLLRQQVEPTQIGPDTNLKTTDPYINFFEEASLAGQADGAEKVMHAKKAADSIQQVENQFKDIRIDSLAILAGAYYQQHDYENAQQYFEQARQFSDLHKIPLRMDILFNYCSVLMKLKRYDQAIELIETNNERIQKNPKVKFRFECFHCFCYIFMGNDARVLEIIPQNLGQRPETEYQYFRFIYMILPYLRNDFEGGLREATNFVGYFNRKKEDLNFSAEKELALIYKNFYQTLYSIIDANEQKEMFAQLTERLHAFVQQNSVYQHVLYIQWLEDKLAAF